MTARMYYDADADPKALAGQKIVIIGYGSQGHAHAQNLADSGYDVTVVEANPKALALAAEAGLKTADITDAVKAADVIMILVPDTIQKKVYESSIEPNMHLGQLLMFAHGFNIRFDRIRPGAGIDVGMVAPKGPALASTPGCPPPAARLSPATGFPAGGVSTTECGTGVRCVLVDGEERRN